MIDKLEIDHLITLDALYKFGNISLVAEHLSVSQQAISIKLKKIRTILADDLFFSTGHGMKPTPYAKQIESHIQRILLTINEMPLSQTFIPEEIERTFVVSATDYNQQIIVADMLGKLNKYAPKIKIIITNIESANLTRKMQQGDIDLALTTSGYVPDGLLSIPLFTEKYVCVSSTQLAKANEYFPISELAGKEFIITSPGVGSFKGSADTWFEQQGYSRNVVASAPSFFMTKECLKHSDMVAFIPSKLMPCDGLFEIPLEKYPAGYEVVAAYHPSVKDDPLMNYLLEMIKGSSKTV